MHKMKCTSKQASLQRLIFNRNSWLSSLKAQSIYSSAQQHDVEKTLLSYPSFRKFNIRSVCTKLVSGQSVLAETFPSVTVYFGDIVGFTAMWANSPPLEVDMKLFVYTVPKHPIPPYIVDCGVSERALHMFWLNYWQLWRVQGNVISQYTTTDTFQ